MFGVFLLGLRLLHDLSVIRLKTCRRARASGAAALGTFLFSLLKHLGGGTLAVGRRETHP